MNVTALFGIAELAELGGVSRRTVRYYIQEGLLPPPLGVGRGRHYGRAHLARLLRVKALQEQGYALAEVRRVIEGRASAPAGPRVEDVPRSAWTRLELLPGIELLVSSERRLPPPSRLQELADWCRRHFRRLEEDEDV